MAETNTKLHEVIVKSLKSAPTDIQELQVHRENAESVVLQEDAYPNYVNHIVRAKCPESIDVLIKYAPPYAKMAGEETPLSSDRLSVDRFASQHINTLVARLCTRPLYLDNIHSTLMTEDVAQSTSLSQQVLDGAVNKDAVEHLGRSLGRLHQQTRSDVLSPDKFNHMKNHLRNTQLKNLVSRLVFEKPFQVSNDLSPEVMTLARNRVWGNDRLKAEVTKFKSLFNDKEECLIVGNLQPEIVAISASVSTLTDCQYARVGPAAYDIATVVSYFIMAYHHHMLTPEDHDRQHRIAMMMVEYCSSFVDAYLSEISVSSGKQAYVNTLMSEVAGFTGVLVVARSLDSPVTPALDNRSQVAIEALDSGVRLIDRSHRIHSIGMLQNIALMLTW